jgi:hypothetical protein
LRCYPLCGVAHALGEEIVAVKAGKAVAAVAALAIGLVIAVALATQTWRSDSGHLEPGLGPIGALHSVLLTNNQVYYGTLEKVGSDFIVLTRVFYVQVTDPKSNERTNKLVERASSDWHAPTQMMVPLDKIIFVEVVGPESSVAKLIAQATTGH